LAASEEEKEVSDEDDEEKDSDYEEEEGGPGRRSERPPQKHMRHTPGLNLVSAAPPDLLQQAACFCVLLGPHSLMREDVLLRVSQDKKAVQVMSKIILTAIAKKHGISQKTQQRDVLEKLLLRAQSFRDELATKDSVDLCASLEAARGAWWGFVGENVILSTSDLKMEADIAGVWDSRYSANKPRSALRSVGPRARVGPRGDEVEAVGGEAVLGERGEAEGEAEEAE
jgi:hypothetical protein